MKRLIISLLGFFIVLSLYAGLTSAGTCIYPNQTILSLYSPNNTHAAVFNSTYNDPNYQVPICYEQIFGFKYTKSNNPWNCNGNTNWVISLATSNNSHAANKSTSGYNVNICYGDLSCQIVNNPLCPAGYNFTLSMSSLNNSHLSNSSTEASYPYKLCCKVNVASVPDTPPVARITSPIHRQIYYANAPIEFNQSSDGTNLQYKWEIYNDGGTLVFSSVLPSFNYQFITSGTMTIRLNVSNSLGSNIQEIAILVVSSPGIFVYINQPGFNAIITDPGLNVSFGADDSYVINSFVTSTCTSGGHSVNVTCLAGNCPAVTRNAPLACASLPTPVYNFSVNGTPQGFGNLVFNWTFKEGAAQKAAGLVSGVNHFTSASPANTFNDKWIKLVINYTDVPGGISLQAMATRYFTLHQGAADPLMCINNRQQVSNSTTTFLTSEANNYCYSVSSDGVPDILRAAGTSLNDCCSAGKTCTNRSNANNKYSCQNCTTEYYNASRNPTRVPITVCDEYNFLGGTGGLNLDIAEQCKMDCARAADKQKQKLNDSSIDYIGGSTSCEMVNARCEFTYGVPSLNNTFRCVQRVQSDTGACGSEDEQRTITYVYNKTEYNIIGRNWTIVSEAGITPKLCEKDPRTVTVPCKRSVVTLPFFGALQVIGVILLIIIIYIIIFRTNLFKTEKKRRK